MTRINTTGEPKVTRTLMRGLAVLEVFADADAAAPGLSLTDVAARTGIDKATALRLLTTLCVAGYLRRDATTNRYALTAKVLRISSGISWYQALIEQAKGHLVDLRDEVREVVHLGVVEDRRVVYIDKLEVDQSVKLVSAVGQDMPMNTTSLGKAILAHRIISDGEALTDYAHRFEARTVDSLVDGAALHEELVRTAERGYSVDWNENQDGVVCVGAPIFDRTGAAVAAISVSGPEFRMGGRVEQVGPRCRAAADEVTAGLRSYAPSGERSSRSSAAWL